MTQLLRPAIVLFLLPSVSLAASSAAGGAGFTSYLGGSGEERIHDVAADEAGDLWIVGETSSPDFPGIPAAGSSAPNGSRQAFVLRLAYDGASWSFRERFLFGGASDDRALEAVAAGPWIFVVGETESGDFPAQAAPGATPGGRDLFLAVIDRNNRRLTSSMLLGGLATESVSDAVALEASGCVALAVTTDSAGLGGIHQQSAATPDQAALAGATDAWLAGVCAEEATGAASVVHATYLGGSDADAASSLVRRPGGFCVGGSTRSADLPLTVGAAQPALRESADGFIACYATPLDPLVGGFTRIEGSFTAGDEPAHGTVLAAHPARPGELLAAVLSDSPASLFDPAESRADGASEPDGGLSRAVGSLDGRMGRLGITETAAGRVLDFESDGACVLGLAEFDGTASVFRTCATGGGDNTRMGQAQTFAVTDFSPTGLSAEPALLAEGVSTGGAAIWGAAAAPEDQALSSPDAPQAHFGGGDSDATFRLQAFPFLGSEAIVGAADFQSRAIAPGQILTIFGEGFGPETALSGSFDAGTGTLPDLLGGTRVWIAGTALPLLFVSDRQIGAVAPFEIAGLTEATVNVEVGGTLSNPVTLGVAPAAPGFFTASQDGKGQAAALNQDFTVNSAAAPAPAGTSVAFFVSGCGQTTPPGRNGARAPLSEPLPRVVEPVEATIGGLPAAVLYAGAAPGQLEGLCQVNLEAPPTSPAGEVPVQLTIAGVPSQTGVTVAIAQNGGGGPGGPGGFSNDPGEIQSCAQLCSGLRDIFGQLEELLDIPASQTQRGDGCECFSLPFPTRDY